MRPITAQPGHTQGEVTAALASRQFVYADCFTFTPKVGSPLRYTTAPQDVSVVPVGEVSRQTFSAQTLIIKGLRVKNNLGVEVDEQQVEMSYDDSVSYQSALTWPKALLQGRLDGGTLKRDRYIAMDWGNGIGANTNWLGGFPMFLGLISSLDKVGRQTATINVKSNLVLLDRDTPPFLWEPNCKNTWGDTACGVNQATWAVAATVGASPSSSVLPWTGAGLGYNLGKIHIENGDSVTRVRTIARATPSQLFLAYPLDFTPSVGASFMAYPGCTRTSDATYGCPKYHGGTWANFFKGFPFIPVAETGI